MTKFQAKIDSDVAVRETNTAFTSLKTANYTVDVDDEWIPCDTSGGAFTVTLPTALQAFDREFVIKLVTAGNNLTIATPGSETIDLAADHTLNTAGDSVVTASDASNYYIKAERNA